MRKTVMNLLKEVQQELQLLRRDSASCYLGNDTVLTRVQGFKMVAPSDDMGITPHLVMDGFWEMAVTRVFLSKIRPGMRVLDIGANVGYYTLLAGRAVGDQGEVIAFEPEPRNLWYLRHNVSLAGHGWTSVVEKALWNSTGQMRLRTAEPDFCGGHSLIGGDDPLLDETSSVEVQTITLDEYLGENLKVDVIKLDAEGAEPFIFEGMSETLAANPQLDILMEFAPDFVDGAGRDHREHLRHLASLGFSIGLIDHEARAVPLDLDRVDEWVAERAWPQMLLLSRA